MKKYHKIIIFAVFLLLLPGFDAQAATLFLSTKSENVTIGDKFEVEVKINSEDIGFNAAQATIQFPKDILEVATLDSASSIFNIWLQDPVFSNQDGSINFIGGSTSGFAGKSLEILKIAFKVKGSGTANLVFTDGAVTASDGSGTNILSAMKGIKIVSVPRQEIETIIELAKPVQIKRTAAPATVLPVKPAVEVPLYPNQDRWYNIPASFFANWQLPKDVIEVATAVNRNPVFAPLKSEGLFDNKQFPLLEDGIWYLHVRFRNNIDWGPVAHYKISVDTTPPSSFKIQIDSSISDNPSPTIKYTVQDSLSGVSEIKIFVDNRDPLISTSTDTFKLYPQEPGKHKILVRATDRAGNSIEQDIDFEILPIETPLVAVINKKIIIGTDDILVIRGSAMPNVNVIVTIEDKNKFLVVRDEVKSDSQGKWEFSLDKELKSGNYFVSVKAKDSRGAMSLPTSPVKVGFVRKPVISVFGWDITLINLTILLAVSGILVSTWFYRKTLLHLARFERESVIINRDLKNSFNLIKEDLNKISDVAKKNTPADTKVLELNSLNKKIIDSLDRMEKYISKDIEKLE